MDDRSNAPWTILAIACASLLAACPPPVECSDSIPCGPGRVCVSNHCTTLDAGDESSDASDAAADTSDALDATDAVDATDAMDAIVPDDGEAGVPCPSAGPDAGLCAHHPVIALPLPGSSCGTLSGTSQIASTTCQSNTGGPEAVWHAHLTSSTGIALAVDSTLDTVLTVRTNCTDTSPGMEVACNDVQPGTSSALHVVLDPGDYDVVVDQFGSLGSGGNYTLYSNTFVPAANATCATAASLAVPGTVAAESIGTGTSTNVPCRTTDHGPARFYRVTVPASLQLTATVVPTGAWRPYVHAFTTCDATSECRADVATTMNGATAMLLWRNTAATSTDIILAVAAAGDPVDPLGTYSLQVAVAP